MTMKSSIKKTMGLGIGSMAGIFALGSVSNLPGMPAQAKGVSNIASTGISLANIANLGYTGMDLAKKFDIKKKK